MKPTSSLRHFLCIASSVLLAAPLANASTLYWDGGTVNIGTNGNGVSAGNLGNWDTTLTNWDQGNGLAHIAWNNTNLDTALFGGTAGTVTLTAPVTVGGLGFFSNSGYTITAGTQGLTFGTGTNNVRMLNVSGATSTATISGTVTGSGNLVFSSVAPDVGSTLTLSGTSTGGWSGTTTINAGMTLSLSGLNQGLNSTTGITFSGGNITLTNTAGAAVDNNRISSAAITANGGTLTLANTSNANVYTETIGSVALTSGQTNFTFNTNAASTGSQTLTLGGLTRPGATSAVTFSSASGLNTTKNMMVVTGATATTAGQIIGSWATTGTGANALTDYAVYNGSAQVVGAGIAGSTEDLWTASTDAYTTSAGGTVTLTGTRNIAALRNTGASTVLTLATGANLQTYGLLNGAGTLLTVAPGTGGVLTTPTGGGNLHLNAGSNNITVSAPINNNSGNVTVVKDGSSTLTLSGTNGYTGGTVLNAGTLAIGAVSNIGGAGASLTFGGTATLAPSAALNFSTGTLTVNAGAYGTITGNGATAFATTTGAGVLRFSSASSSASLNLGNASGFTGNLEFRSSGNPGYGTNTAIQFSSLGDGVGSALQVGGGQSDSTGLGQAANIVLTGSSAPLVFNNRRIELLPRIASNHTIGITRLTNNNASATNTWVINTDLSYQVDQARNFELTGSNTGNNAFNGIISDGNVGGSINFRKDGAGKWILGGANTYSGTTTIATGTLQITNGSALGSTAGSTTQSGSSQLTIDGSGGAVIVGAEALSISGGGISNGGALRNIVGDNTYGGTITLAAQSRINSDSGTLLLNNATAVTGAGQNLVVGGAGNITISGAITTTTGFVSKDSAGTLTLSGTNTYTGATKVGGGTLNLSFGTIPTNIVSSSSALSMEGGTLQLSHANVGAQTFNGLTTTASTSSRILLAANKTLTLGALTAAGANSYLNFNTAAGGADAGTATVGTSIVTLTGGTLLNTWTVTDSTGFGLAARDGSNQVIRLTGSLLPASGGSSSTNYQMDNNGGGSAAAGSSSLAVTANQSAASITVDTTAASGVLTLNSGVTLSNNTWNFGNASGANTYQITGGTGLNSVATANTITINNYNTGTVTFTSPILAFGANPVVVNGTGTTVFNGLNTYTGGTTISGGGTLQIGSNGILVGGAYAGAIAIGSGSSLRYSGSNAQTLSGAITGAGGLTKDTNTSDLNLTSTGNTYTGTTTVSSGRIAVAAATNLSSGATSIVQSGTGQVYISGAVTIANPFNISGTGYLEGGDSQNNIDGAIRMSGGTLSGLITLSGNSRIGTFGTSTNTISGRITGGFGIDFYGMQNSASASEFFVLSNTGNNYTGNTTIYNSNYNTTNLAGVSTVLKLGASNVIPDGASAGNVAFAINGTNNNATVSLDLNGFNETINGLTVNAGTFATRITNTAVAAHSVLTIGANNTTSSFNGTITDSGTGRTLSITKTGNGILTLSGTSSYIGATTVAGGILAVDGTLGSTATTVQTGGTLQGSGTIGGSVTIQTGGTLATGNSIESLATGTLTLNTGSTFAYEINNNVGLNLAGDLTVVTGDLNITSGAILTIAELGAGTWSIAEKLTLISYTGNWNNGLLTYLGGEVSNSGSIVTTGGYTWTLNYNDTLEGSNYATESPNGENYVTMTLTAIPEPGAALIGSLGLLALLRRRRF